MASELLERTNRFRSLHQCFSDPSSQHKNYQLIVLKNTAVIWSMRRRPDKGNIVFINSSKAMEIFRLLLVVRRLVLIVRDRVIIIYYYYSPASIVWSRRVLVKLILKHECRTGFTYYFSISCHYYLLLFSCEYRVIS